MCKSVNVNSVKGIDSKVMEDKDMLNVVEKLVNWEVSEGFVRGLERKDKRSYAITEVLPFEDKVRVLDHHFDGRMTDILELIDKFRADYKSIKTFRPSLVSKYNTNSFKAWLRKNDTEGLTHSYYIGLIKIGDAGYCLAHFSVKDGDCGFTPKYAVDEAFNGLLRVLHDKENEYYLHHNPDVLYVKSVCKNLENYGYGQCVVFSMGSSGDYLVYRYDSSKGYIIEKANDSNGHAFTKTPLSIEEVKTLDKALAPVEEKYQLMLRAKEELESALEQAGVDFLDAVGIK